jgi:hypothetical protein
MSILGLETSNDTSIQWLDIGSEIWLEKLDGNFSLPSALHAKPIVMQNRSFFLPLVCFEARPQSGGALEGCQLLFNQS